MTELEDTPWKGTEADLPTGRDLVTFERELALVDRILGLEAELARYSIASSLTPDEQLAAEDELARLRGSLTWRAGRLVSAPMRVIRRATGRPAE